jgi:hypothetical protein
MLVFTSIEVLSSTATLYLDRIHILNLLVYTAVVSVHEFAERRETASLSQETTFYL